MPDKLYFDPEQLISVQTDLLFYIFAHLKTLQTLHLSPEKYSSKEDITILNEKHREQIINAMYSEYGHTPDFNDKDKT